MPINNPAAYLIKSAQTPKNLALIKQAFSKAGTRGVSVQSRAMAQRAAARNLAAKKAILSTKGAASIGSMLGITLVAGTALVAAAGIKSSEKKAKKAIRGRVASDRSRYDTNKKAIAKIRSMDKDDPKRKRLMKSLGARYK